MAEKDEKRRSISLRRELQRDRLKKIHDVGPDLATLPRDELERRYREAAEDLNKYIRAENQRLGTVRDVLSFQSGGKSMDALHLNRADAEGTHKPTFGETLKTAGHRALGGGLMGAFAMSVQVTTLMWLRTTMNYQYRHGTSTREALRTLYAQGGVLRFYRGYGPALIQGPLSRFGDTAANAGMLALLDGNDSTKRLPIPLKTMLSSAAAASWRVFLMPVDTLKTVMQVEGSAGVGLLTAKAKEVGPKAFYQGAAAASAATFVGHFPWFFTHNLLNEYLPKAEGFQRKLVRNAAMGFCSSVVSDVCSNSLRVIKTTKQAATEQMSYTQTVKMVVDKDGYAGLFGRGLKTRIMTNGVQGIMFTIIWKSVEDNYKK